MAEPLDLVARKVLCLSLLYYGLDVSLVQDQEFDAMCKRLHDEWEGLDPFRQWQLEPRADIRASGFHAKITPAAAHGALSWSDSRGVSLHGGLLITKPWNETEIDLDSPGGGVRLVRWLNPSDFTWNTRLKPKGKPRGRAKSGRSPGGGP